MNTRAQVTERPAGGSAHRAESGERSAPAADPPVWVAPAASVPALDELPKAYISRSALRANARLIAARAGVPLCAMVKANAYGHDVTLVTEALKDTRIAFWGVATVQEALEIRSLGHHEPILVFRPVDLYDAEAAIREQIDAMIASDLRATVAGEAGLDVLADQAAQRRRPLAVHLKVDTGMGRHGCGPDEALRIAQRLAQLPHIRLEGIYSHFAAADEADLAFARAQLSTFLNLLRQLETLGIRPPLRHMANSGAIFNLEASRLDLVRPGLALYGYTLPAIRDSQDLRPVLRVEAPILCTKRVPRGGRCGYGGTYTAQRELRIGLLPVGYADGYSRHWSNAGRVAVLGRIVPVIGRISMDSTIVDLTDVPEAGPGTPVELVSGRRGDPHSIEAMAGHLGTIPYELTCLLGPRIRRILTD